MSLDRDLQFLYEVGSLRYIPRMWHRYSNTDFANITEHHFRVIWIALMIAAHEKTGDADNIDVDLELMEQKAKGSTLPDALAETRQVVAKNKLYTKSAKKIWKTVIESSPHDWHRKGRNRLNSGDWKS
jgi:hypothetical protein